MFSSSSTADDVPLYSGAVLELSCLSLRLGCSGEVEPQAEIPMGIGIPSGSLALPTTKTVYWYPLNPLEIQQDTEVIYPLLYDSHTRRYSVSNKAGLQQALEFSLGSRYFTSIPPIEMPLLVAESAVTDPELRGILGEIIFESLQGNGLYFCKQPTLATFACGRTSAIVWGYSRTTASITVEGYTQPNSVVEIPLGGDYFNSKILDMLKEKPNETNIGKIAPAFSYDPITHISARRPFISDSYWDWATLAVIENMKRLRCEFGPDRQTPKLYSLPDGTSIDTSEFAIALPELLCNGPIDILNSYFKESLELQSCGWGSLIEKSIQLSEMRSGQKPKEGIDAIVLAGGATCYPNFIKRFKEDIDKKEYPVFNNPDLKVLYPPDPSLRRHSTFIGGSILTCLGSFKSFVVPKSDYEEFGSSVFQRKCP